MLREILARYGRLRAGYLWAFVTPLAQVAALYTVWIILWDRDDANLPILLFLVTGVLPFWLFRQSVREGATAAIRNQHLFKLPPVTIFDITFAHTLLELVTMLLVFGVAVFGTRLLGEAPRVQDPLGVLIGFVLMWTMGTGLGMTLAGLSKKLPAGAQVYSVASWAPSILHIRGFLHGKHAPDIPARVATLQPAAAGD